MVNSRPSTPSHRTQRALSLAADTRKPRDVLSISPDYPYINTFASTTCPSVPAVPTVPTLPVFYVAQPPSPRQELLFTDLEHFQRTKPSMAEHKKEAQIAQRQRREQIVLMLQQQQIEAQEKAKLEKQERQQAKQERKQRRSEYKQLYREQYEGTSQPKDIHKQHSLPINAYTHEPSSPHFHPSHHYHLDSQQHEGNCSSSSSTNSRSSRSTPDRVRSLSLKSNAKSMSDLRPSHSNEYYYNGYESDENTLARPHDWDSLMDTLHSPTLSSPSDSLQWEEPERDLMDSMNGLTLSNGNGNGKYLLVLGANGRTGIELVKQALERNYRVTAFVRDDKLLLEESSLRKNHNLLIVKGSPTSQADLDRCVEGQDVVVNVIGARLMASDATIGSHSQVVLNNALKKHGVRRLIVVTSYGCHGLRNYLAMTRKLFSRVFMTGILKDKVLQEDIIQRDTESFDWTVVRPVTLRDGDLSERYWVCCEELPKTKVKMLTRKDLAHYILTIINRPQEYQKIRSIAGKKSSAGKAGAICKAT
ncbi:hypothetical protein KVV02_006588 [Mortierella alpina]|uniref:NAD(P)-binding domain-containing protein n=1 Tax=Mortierella alpina TaxID=64518 RepID=A0A9P8CZC1_MORAP|nr:hypothetical protein KVV02_006588 [Mortierella alpina]